MRELRQRTPTKRRRLLDIVEKYRNFVRATSENSRDATLSARNRIN